MVENFISSTAILAESVKMAGGCKIWHGAHIRENVTIGENVIIGGNVYIGPGVSIGNNVKIQNNSLIYEPAAIGEGVFIGPGVIFTNDHNPRAVNPNKSQKKPSDWELTRVTVGEGASIGAGAVCVGEIKIGNWALIGAGAVLVQDVHNFALVVGVPAKQIGWVGKSGFMLVKQEAGIFKCPRTNELFRLDGKILVEESN